MIQTEMDSRLWRPKNLLPEFLRNSDDDNSPEMNVDGSVSTVTFTYVVPDGQHMALTQVNVLLLDEGVDNENFGNLPALTTGVEVTLRDSDGSELVDLCAGVNIIRNADWAPLAGTKIETKQGGSVQDSLVVTWNFREAYGASVTLTKKQCLQFKIQDDLSDIFLFRAMVQGLLYKPPPGQ